jgi:RNA polymerase sigma-70 factor (ECF subfamily)
MLTHEQLSETELIRRIVGGDKGLFEILVRRFNPNLYKTGRTYNLLHEDVQDLMQETFIDAYKSLAKFEGRSSFKTWIIRIMMNNCLRKMQKASFSHEIHRDIPDNATPMFSHNGHDGSDNAHNQDLKRIIEEALARIPFDHRMTYSMREINGLSTRETADLLNITDANVKVRLNRAKVMLRAEIEKRYSAEELFEFNLVHCDAIVEQVMKAIRDL